MRVWLAVVGFCLFAFGVHAGDWDTRYVARPNGIEVEVEEGEHLYVEARVQLNQGPTIVFGCSYYEGPRARSVSVYMGILPGTGRQSDFPRWSSPILATFDDGRVFQLGFFVDWQGGIYGAVSPALLAKMSLFDEVTFYSLDGRFRAQVPTDGSALAISQMVCGGESV